jgi:4-amino-4-deoxy-L-arabinose transferase-like glycosyltransferase
MMNGKFKLTNLKIYFLITIIGVIFFLPYLGTVHLFDWDEINFAEASREMIATNDYLTVRIDYQPFHEKPPLFFWAQAISMRIFGINEFAARFPNAVIGIISLLVIFYIGNKLFDYKFGILWVLSYLGSFLPHFYFKTGIIDPYFNLFIFLGIYNIYQYYTKNGFIEDNRGKYKNIIFAGIFILLAMMTKGPVGYLLATLSWLVFWFIKRNKIKFPIKAIIIYSLISCLPVILWYVIILSSTGGNILAEFIAYQLRLLTTKDAGHGGPIYYHIVILFFGCFPASIFAIKAFTKNNFDNIEQWNFRLIMIILFGVVLGIFSLVNTKIIHYSSLAYFPLTFLSAKAIYDIVYNKMKWNNFTTFLILLLGLIFSISFIGLPIFIYNKEKYIPLITDNFTKELLKANVPMSGYEYLLGVFYLLAVIITVIILIKKSYLNGFICIITANALLIFALMPILAPKIEQFTQATPIEFYKSLENKKCYVEVLGFKSYAHYYYTNKPLELSAYYYNMNQDDFKNKLMNEKINLPAYFVCKINDEKKYTENQNLIKILEKNGFVFFTKK